MSIFYVWVVIVSIIFVLYSIASLSLQSAAVDVFTVYVGSCLRNRITAATSRRTNKSSRMCYNEQLKTSPVKFEGEIQHVQSDSGSSD